MISLATALVIVLALSWALSELISWVEETSAHDHPLTPVYAAVGVLYSLGAAYAVDGTTVPVCTRDGYIHASTLALVFFAASVPLFIGSITRWIRRRRPTP